MSESHVIDYLKTRREYCRALLELSRRQRDFIAAGDYSELLSLVSRKQRVLGRMDALKTNQPPVIAEWNDRRGELETDLRVRCESLLNDTDGLLEELLTEEQFCTDRLAERRDQTRRELAEIAGGRTAQTAYSGDTTDTTHRYLDVNQ